jgi:signal transduction histidine kinase
MSSLANVIELPVRQEFEGRDSIEHDLVLALATADDLVSGIDAVVGRIRRDSGAARAEWWAKAEDGALELVAVDGIAHGARDSLPLEPAGVLVLHGARLDRQVESALTALAPIIRRRAAEERLARTTIQLAQRNEALEDFAALVVHELKTPLQTALVADDPSRSVEDAILLVDGLLEASRNQPSEERFASVAECLEQAVEDLRVEIEITADVAPDLPGLATDGGYDTVDAASHDPGAATLNGFMFSSGPSRRFIGEAQPNGIRATQVIPGGESGEPADPTFGNQLGLWLTNDAHPALQKRHAVQQNAASEETFVPNP